MIGSNHHCREKSKAIVFLSFVLPIFTILRNKNKNKIHSDHFPIELKSKDHFPIELKSKETRFCVSFDFNSIGKWFE